MAITSPSRAALLLPALLGACGLAPGSAETISIPTDGINGFGDASPIELCVGSARVVSASVASAGSGLCVRKGASAAPCADDASCSGIERCICGRCIVEACQGAASCGDGRVCRGKRCTTSCSDDSRCLLGERCISGGCARVCSNDSVCHSGERCDPLDGVCASKLCGGALTCGSAADCELERVAGEVHEPSIALLSGGPVAFLEIRDGGASLTDGIYRARIDTSYRWTADPEAPILLPLPGETRVGAPSALARAGGSLELYMDVDDGAFLARATSTDGGVTFSRAPSPVLEPSDPWEAGRVASPSVVEYGSISYLFYEGGHRAGLGLARLDSTTGAASRLSSDPIALPGDIEDPVLWRSVTEIGSPHAIVADGALRLYFTARGAEGGDSLSGTSAVPADLNDSIGLLTTRDLTSFARYPAGPVFSRVANLRGYLGEREPFVALAASTRAAEITFLATDAQGVPSGLAHALSR